MNKVDVGHTAPDLTMATHTGEEISLADYRGNRPVVVFFYPSDGTPLCTKEACAFRDSYEEFTEVGAAVIGISGASVDKHRDFAQKHGLQFILVADNDGSVRRAFGVPKTLGVFPGRVTYVIDREGIVRHVFNSQLATDRHVQEALDIVRELKK